MRRLLLIVSLLLVFSATPALAITDGELDGNDHPMVGLMVANGWHEDEDGETVFGPMWRCSGTLISPTIFVTAGHCTEQPAESAQVWFGSDMRDKDATGYPDTGGVMGRVHTHPLYYDGPWWLHDLGVVVLRTPVRLRQYADLPELDQIDKLVFKRGGSSGKGKLGFTAVGYGLQKSFPTAAGWKDVAERIRMVAHPKLIQINVPGSTGTQTLLLSNNTSTGGTCFGDSGGPNFIADTFTIGGVTSFGKNSTCAGQGGVYRVDRSDDLRWLNSFLR